MPAPGGAGYKIINDRIARLMTIVSNQPDGDGAAFGDYCQGRVTITTVVSLYSSRIGVFTGKAISRGEWQSFRQTLFQHD